MTDTQATEAAAALTKLTGAASVGDQAARDALDNLVRVASKLPNSPGEQGRAEARRRFGTPDGAA